MRMLWAVVAVLVCSSPVLAQLRPAAGKVLSDLPYVADGHQRQKLDLILPSKSDKPAPVVVWIHGGAWRAGDKARNPAQFLVGRGYAVASINYRLVQHASMPAQIEDCKAAIRWLRANAKEYNLDSDHIGVWGASAGGHLVALLGTAGDIKELEGELGNPDQSSRVQCVVDWFGPTDFLAMGRTQERPEAPVAQLLGGPLSQKQEAAKLASPITHVTKDDPPFLIMHGDKDTTVGVRQSYLLADKLKATGVEVELKVLQGAGHGGAEFLSADSRKLIEGFFAKHLRK